MACPLWIECRVEEFTCPTKTRVARLEYMLLVLISFFLLFMAHLVILLLKAKKLRVRAYPYSYQRAEVSQNGSTTNRGTRELVAFNWLNGFHTPSPTTRQSARAPTYIHRQTLIATSFAGLAARNAFKSPTRITETRFLSRVRAGYRQLDSESDKGKQSPHDE